MAGRLRIDAGLGPSGARRPESPDDPRWLGAAREHGLRDVVRWMATRRPARWPKWIQASPSDVSSSPTGLGPWHLGPVTLINHSTVLLELGGANVLTDPIFSQRCSPVSVAGPKRCRAPGVALEDLPRIDLVLLSHDHYDHCDRASLQALGKAHEPLIVTGAGNARRLKSFGLSRVVELSWWQHVDLLAAEDVEAPKLRGSEETGSLGPVLSGTEPLGRLTFVPAQHFSGRGAFDRNRTAWGGFVLQSAEGPVYFAGDTGYSETLFDRLLELFGPMRLALLPIGAYEPRWFMGPVHMDPAEALRAHGQLRSRRSVGMHYGTFQLTDEAVEAPLDELATALRASSFEPDDFLAPRQFGERLTV